MAQMIDIEFAHWIDPDVVYQAYTTDSGEVRGSYKCFGVVLMLTTGVTTTLGRKLTGIQANKLMRRIANAQTKPLEVRWLCKSCHQRLHTAERNAKS